MGGQARHLGCGVVGLAGVADLAHDGRHVDDAPALLAHHRADEGRLRAEKHTLQLHVEGGGRRRM